jgi:DNA-directed RNA polymerase specialized sigma54-like protein
LQGTLSQALTAIGEREANADNSSLSTYHLEQAIVAARAALRTLTIKNAPVNRADDEGYLGDALEALGERLRRADYLEQAVAAYREQAKI